MAAVLIGHICIGAAGLALGLWALLAPKRPGHHTRAGRAYCWLVLGTALSGAILTLEDFQQRWVFIPLGVLMAAFAMVADRAVRRRRPGWLVVHAPCQVASYFFMVEAAVITNWPLLTLGHPIPNGYAWLIPSLVFYPVIAWVYVHARKVTRRSAAG